MRFTKQDAVPALSEERFWERVAAGSCCFSFRRSGEKSCECGLRTSCAFHLASPIEAATSWCTSPKKGLTKLSPRNVPRFILDSPLRARISMISPTEKREAEKSAE